MSNLKNHALTVRVFINGFLTSTEGQDMIEYALMTGVIALGAGALMPNVATSISTIFSKLTSTLNVAGGLATSTTQGS